MKLTEFYERYQFIGGALKPASNRTLGSSGNLWLTRHQRAVLIEMDHAALEFQATTLPRRTRCDLTLYYNRTNQP